MRSKKRYRIKRSREFFIEKILKKIAPIVNSNEQVISNNSHAGELFESDVSNKRALKNSGINTLLRIKKIEMELRDYNVLKNKSLRNLTIDDAKIDLEIKKFNFITKLKSNQDVITSHWAIQNILNSSEESQFNKLVLGLPYIIRMRLGLENGCSEIFTKSSIKAISTPMGNKR
jgi:hypothetical protein